MKRETLLFIDFESDPFEKMGILKAMPGIDRTKLNAVTSKQLNLFD